MIWPLLFKRWIALSMHLINHYPVDKYQENQLRYPVARELYDGQRYPPFEQLGPEGRQKSTLKFSWCPFYEGGSLINRQPVQRGGVCTDMCLIKTTTLVQLNPSEDIVIFTYPWFEFLSSFFSLCFKFIIIYSKLIRVVSRINWKHKEHIYITSHL